MKEQLLLSWQINNNKNLLLLQHTGEDMLKSRVSAKGRNVGEQLAHLHQVRLTWVDALAKSIVDKNLELNKSAELSVAVLSRALTASAQK
ncbi:MAG TPA: DinB family protein [Flavisolibacter sp.]|nr:DinB family protein [Flavisolibacter sp.]